MKALSSDRAADNAGRWWAKGTCFESVWRQILKAGNFSREWGLSSTSEPFIPYGRQCIDDDDVKAVVEVLKSDWLTTGPVVEAFERELAERVGARYAVSCSSGTAALHLAALASQLTPEDRVAVPAMTFVATANAARYVGAEVAFCDVDPSTGLMRAQDLEDILTRHQDIKAVFPVHLNGASVDMEQISALAMQHDLLVVEDGSHALGTPGVGACAYSDMTIFSFHPVKTVAMGEGGAITTNREDLYRRLLQMRSHGIVRDAEKFSEIDQARDASGKINPWYYEMQDLGFNYRASDIHCALGLSQLKKLDRFVKRRQDLMRRYHAGLDELRPLVSLADVGHSAWHLCAPHIDFEQAGLSRAELMDELRKLGIGSQVHYLPVNRQPYYRERYGPEPFPGCDAYYDQVISLPLYFSMSDNDVDRVIGALKSILNSKGNIHD